MIYEIKSSETFQASSNKVKSGYCVKIRRDKDDKGLEFMIGNILPRKTEEDIKSSKQFALLTAYLEYKGAKFQDTLYSLYQKAHEELDKIAGTEPDQFKNYAILHRVLDIFDYADVVHFLKDVYKLKPLSILPDTFDMQTQKDEDGTREQTYTKNDYIELAGLVIIIKATFMLLGHMAYLCEDRYPDMNAFLKVLYKFYARHDKIGSIAPMEKLIQFTEKLFYNPKHSEKDLLSMVIKKGLSDVEIIETLVAQVIFHKLTISSVIEDDNETYIVNTMFKFVTNKIKPQDNKGQCTITEKAQILVSDDRNERESTFESYIMQTDITTGDAIKVNWASDSMEIIIPQLHPHQQELILKGIKTSSGNTYTYKDIHNFISSYGYFIYQDQTIIMLHPIFKGILDQRLFDYVDSKNMLNFLALAIPYVWNLGFGKLALLLASIPVQAEEKMVTINISTGRNRIPQELLDALYEVFPLYRVNKKDGEKEYNIRKDIEVYANSFYKGSWKTMLPKDMVTDAYGSPYEILPVPDELKIIISEFLLTNEKYAYRSEIKK